MATTYREADRFIPKLHTSYKDPAQVVFESIPTDHATTGTTAVFDAANRRYGNLESAPCAEERLPAEPRASRQWSAGTNPYNWPMKPAPSGAYNWPIKPETSSPIVPPPPPKIPSTTYEIQIDDEVLPLRPAIHKSRSFSPDDPGANPYIRPVPSVNSIATVRPSGEVPIPDRPRTSSASASSLSFASATSDEQSFEPARAAWGRRPAPLPPSITPGGRVIVQAAPSPPLPTSRSAGSAESSQSILNTSIRPVAPVRPFIKTHVRPLSPDGPADDTPVVEVAGPMPPHSGFESSSSQSHASISPPPGSPPPPYSNPYPAPRRRTNSYYLMAEERSNQIMSESTSPMPTCPPPRKDMPSFAQSAAASAGSSRRSARGSSPPPMEQPRPLSAMTNSSVMTDETMESVSQATRSTPTSIASGSPPLSGSTYAGAQVYRPFSTASAPAEETRSRTSSASSVSPMFSKYSRSHSMATIMAEDMPGDLDLRPIESAPAGIRRKPLPPRNGVTDTYKEAVVLESPFDTLKEVMSDRPASLPLSDHPRHYSEPSVLQRPRPLDIRNRLTDTSKEIVSAPALPPEVRLPLTDTAKEIVPDSPLEPQIQVAPPAQPMSHVEMIRKRNMERKQQGGRRRLRIVNA